MIIIIVLSLLGGYSEEGINRPNHRPHLHRLPNPTGLSINLSTPGLRYKIPVF